MYISFYYSATILLRNGKESYIMLFFIQGA